MEPARGGKIVRPMVYDAPEVDADSLPLEKRRVLSAVRGRRKVLEVGCSTGNFTRHLSSQGSLVTGIELDPDAAVKAKAFARSVVVGDIDDPGTWKQLNEKFDVIVFMHVLEHLVDPWRVLSQAKDYLARDGNVLILLPNIACWEVRSQLFFRGNFQYRDFGILDISHLRFFTLDTARELIQKAGYTIEELEVVGSTVPFAGKMKALPLLKHLIPSWEKLLTRFWPNLCGATFFFNAVSSS